MLEDAPMGVVKCRHMSTRDDLCALKRAHALAARVEPCANARCACATCECGPACECGIPGVDDATRVTCEPCVAFVKDRMKTTTTTTTTTTT